MDLYGYVNNAPTDETDPSGLSSVGYVGCAILNALGWYKVKVKAIVLYGSRAWNKPEVVENDFKQANKIFAQARIRIVKVEIEQWDKKKTESVTGKELLITPSFHKGAGGVGSPTPEEMALTRGQTATGVVYVYYVRGFWEGKSITMGYSFSVDSWPSPPAPSFIIADLAETRPEGNVWSHELGHILLANAGAHVTKPGSLGPGSEPNLMSDRPNIAWVISPSQAERMRKNKLVTPLVSP